MATAAIISGVAIGITGAIYGGVSAYQNGIAQQNAYNDAAMDALTASRLQANAEQQQAQAKYDEYLRQAKIEEARAGIEQIQGEQEAEKRSRQLAYNIGSIYANAAGNGLLVDGNVKDTLGAALRTSVAEGQADISTIRDNTAMNVWTRQTNAASLKTSAANALTAGYNNSTSYLFQGLSEARSNIAQGKIAYKSGLTSMVTGILGSVGSGMTTIGASMKSSDS